MTASIERREIRLGPLVDSKMRRRNDSNLLHSVNGGKFHLGISMVPAPTRGIDISLPSPLLE